MLDSSPKLATVARVQFSLPKGRLRRIESRIASASASVIGALTNSVQSPRRSISSAVIWGTFSVAACGEPRLDQGQSSARATNPARSGFRSTYRTSVMRWSSSWVGNALNRPCQTWPL